MAIIDSTFVQMLDWLGTMTFPIPPPGPLAVKNQFHGGIDFSEGIDSVEEWILWGRGGVVTLERSQFQRKN
jgi:hypothetical protein